MSHSQKLLTIAIPTYNRCDLLEKTLRNVFSQEWIEKVEVLVVDNASTDNTSEMIKKYNVRYI